MPANSTASNALSTDATKTGKSPLYGCDSYLAVGAVFRKTYISTTVPSHILKGIGTIVSKPPGIGQFSRGHVVNRETEFQEKSTVSRTGA